MTSPAVSVVMTVRNGERTVGGVIESILNQSFTDFEFLIVDDGSTDITTKIVDRYGREDARCVLINQGPVGRGCALNVACRAARGRYLAIVDADDPSHSERLSLQYQYLEQRKDVDVLGTNVQLVCGRSIAFRTLPHPLELTSKDVTSALVLGNPIAHSSVMMRRDKVMGIGGYEESRAGQYDYDLWVRLKQAGAKLHVMQLVLAAKVIHDHQSFEGKRGIPYYLGSVETQLRAAESLLDHAIAPTAALARLIYWLIPYRLRTKLRSVHQRA